MSGPSEGYIAFALSHDQWMVSMTPGNMAAPFEATPMVVYYGFNLGNFYSVHEH